MDLSHLTVKAILYDSDGNELSVEDRSQTPSGKALNVQIGPGDVVSNIPVMIDFDHHQVHEGETYRAEEAQTSLGTNTVKYAFTVDQYTDTIRAPHLVTSVDVYNGTVLVQIYEGATYTGGSFMTPYNRNRNSSNRPGSSVKTGVTSTSGTLIDSFYAGAGSRSAGNNRQSSEWVLKSNTVYRIDVIGKVAGTEAFVSFNWYEDLGV